MDNNTKAKRNAKGGGTVRQRPDGRWEARCTINGKRHSFYADKQQDALKAMRAAQKAEDDGLFFDPSNTTLGKWLDTWLNEYVKPSVKANTYVSYEVKVKHIKLALGQVKLKDLNSTQIQKFYNDLSRTQQFSNATIGDIHSALRTALNKAVNLRYLLFNPTKGCSLPKKERNERKPFSEEDISAFLKEITNNKQYEKYKYLFLFTLYTGVRKGEACGLSWDEVDFVNNTITIKQQLLLDPLNGDYVIASPKSRDRTIVPAPYVMEMLKTVRKEQMANHFAMGLAWENKWNLVFTDKEGRFIRPQRVYENFKKAAITIGRPDAHFHDLRHTYAVTSIQEGDDIKTVQMNLGHATASFTLDVYGHVSTKMQQESSKRMQSYIEKLNA